MKPTCDADANSGRYGGDGSRLDQPDQDQAERVEEQAGPEEPVEQGPGSAGRGHDGARVPPRPGIVLLKAVLLTQSSRTSGIQSRQFTAETAGGKHAAGMLAGPRRDAPAKPKPNRQRERRLKPFA